MIKTALIDFAGYGLPDLSEQALYNYFVHGLEPGGFITAVLANDLLAASAKADHWNKSLITQYAKWLAFRAPPGSYGSYDAVRGWLSKNEHYNEFQKAIAFDMLKTAEPAPNDPLF